jgi:hypothetical protein
MKKRSLGMVIALVVAFSLLAVTAYASTPTYEGYEAFKALAKNVENNHEDKAFKQENATVTGAFTVIDNGVKLVHMETELKAQGEDNASGTVKYIHEGVTKELKVYAEDEKVYIFDVLEDIYYLADREAMKAQHDGSDVEDEYNQEYSRKFSRNDMTDAQEKLMDFLMGDLKDDFELQYNSDGSETIKFELTKEEIPMLLNLVVSAASGQERRTDEYEEFSPDTTLLEKYPILRDFVHMEDKGSTITENVELDYVQLALTTREDEFLALSFDFKLTGDDEVGMQHNVQIKGNVQVAEIGTTVADKVNLEGKDIIEIEPEDFEEFDGNRRVHGRGASYGDA